MHHGGHIAQTLQTVTEEGLQNSAARWLPAKTVCLSRTASVGYVTILDRPMATSQDFVNWICSDALDPEFLMRLFQAEERALKDRFGKGSTHTTIYYPEVKAFHVCLPPVREQRRIVDKIQALMARSARAKEALDAIPPLLDRFRQSVLAAAFRGDLTADWRAQNPDVEPADQLLDRIRAERRRRWEEEFLAKQRVRGREPRNDKWKARYKPAGEALPDGLPTLPSSWVWISAEECTWEITVGHVGPMQKEYTEGGVPFLRSQNVRENRYDSEGLTFISPTFHEKLKKSALRPGDVVVVRSGAPGTACVIPEGLGEANCADLVIVRLLPEQDPFLLAYYLNSPGALARVRGAQVGVAQQHFNVGSMKKKPLPLIPVAEQAEIRRRLESLLARADAIEERFLLGQSLTDSLERAVFAKAFRGELVPQDPNDEPASALLERIRAERQAAEPKKKKRRRKKAAAR